MPNQLFSIDLLQPKVVDVVSDDKIYPPNFKTVQNRQPIPEGAFKKRDGLVQGDVVANSSEWECQLITPFFLNGSSNADTIAAYSEEHAGNSESSGTATGGNATTLIQSAHTWSTDEWAGEIVRIVRASLDDSVHYATISSNDATTLTFPSVGFSVASSDTFTISGHCHLFKYVGSTWTQITLASSGDPASSIINEGFYYVCNALSAKGNDINPVLILVKAESTNSAFDSNTEKNSCFAIYRGMGDKGTATGGSTTVLNDTNKLWVADEWIGGTLEITSGTGSGQTATITDSFATQLVFDTLSTGLNNTSVYRLTSANTTDYFVKSFGNKASTKVSNIKTLNWQSAMCAEYHLNKLWVGGLREPFNPDLIASATNPLVNRHNRIRWSKTGDWDNNYIGTGAGDAGSWGEAGTGYLDVPVTGEHRVVGLRQFRGQLYALTTSDLFVVTGTTSAQFGLTRIAGTPSAVGQTMWASDNYLFWADANGIQQFNGSQIKNVTEDTVPLAYKQKQIEQYDILGTTVATGYGKVPTAFINEKLKIYGIHWPNLSSDDYAGSPNLPGKETWLYNYKSQAFSKYVYNQESNYNDVNYVSDYHDTGFVWMGMCNTSADNPMAAKYTFEPGPNTDSGTATSGSSTTLVDSNQAWDIDEWIGATLKITDASDSSVYYVTVTDSDATSLTFVTPGITVAASDTYAVIEGDLADPGGAITTILETGDLNLASLNGFSYEDSSRLSRLDLYVVPDSYTDVTYKLDITVDNAAQAQQTVTVSASSGATQPQYVVVPLPTMKTGSFFRIKLTEDTASVKGDLRRADLFYEVMFKRGGARK